MALSIVTYTGNGTETTYALNFALGILSRGDVTCRVGNEVDGLGNPVYRDLEWINDGLVTIQGAAPGAGVPIVFTRTVPKDALVHDYENGAAIEESNLDESNKQNLMAIHEFMDGRLSNFAVNLNMNGFRIINLGDGIADTDAASMRQINAAIVASDEAVQAAISANAAADSAEDSRDIAVSAANSTAGSVAAAAASQSAAQASATAASGFSIVAQDSATLAEAWAEGTLPGGPGTKSAREYAEIIEDVVVSSVNGEIGDVVLDADDISEGTTNKYMTAAERSKLSGIASGAQVNTVASVNAKTGTVVLNADDISDASTTKKFTSTAEKNKLAGIASGAQVNQNAFSTIAVPGEDSVSADAPSDTLTIVAGSGVTITTEPGVDTITISSSSGGIVAPETSTDRALSAWVGGNGDELRDTGVRVIGAGYDGIDAHYGGFSGQVVVGDSLYVTGGINIKHDEESDFTTGIYASETANVSLFVPNAGGWLLTSESFQLNDRITAGGGIDITGDGDAIVITATATAENITGLISEGTNVTITGSGTSISPYVINASGGGGGGAVDSVNGKTGIVVLDTGDISEGTNLYLTEGRVLDAVQDNAVVHTKQHGFAQANLSIIDGDVDWDLEEAQSAYVVLSENATLKIPTNPIAGFTYTLAVQQDGTGGRTLSFDGFYGGLNGILQAVSPAPFAISIYEFTYNGTYMVGRRVNGGSMFGAPEVGSLAAAYDAYGNLITIPVFGNAQGRMRGFRGYMVTVNSDVVLSPETLVGSDYLLSGTNIRADATASARTYTLPANGTVGDTYEVFQFGAYDVTFVAESGATLVNRSGHTKIAGQDGRVILTCTNNVGGSAARWNLAGDTK